MRGLYIHIPFCKTICSYCDFPKLVSSEERQEKYIDYLLKELDNYKYYLNAIDTIYIGGGTPNSLNLRLLEKLLISIYPYLLKTKENTIELNPELIDSNLCELLFKYNFNRVSIGVQTIDDDSIKLLNRHHTKKNVIEAIRLLKHANINNINVDLIYGIPNTNMDVLKRDLDFIMSLDINHLSCYSLILEEKTIFKYLHEHQKLTLIDDDTQADMYDYINERLVKEGFHHYEISNYAKPGFESLHNLHYWNCDEYIGIGLGAAGYLNSTRYTNANTMKEYFNNEFDEKSYIDIKERKKEYLILGLRLVDGVSIDKYFDLFKSNLLEDFKLEYFFKNKLLIKEGSIIRIPEDKLFISNYILEEIID
ncbi:MAG: radical SAM family heme chaperone HemW [Anaeroplasma sp.]